MDETTADRVEPDHADQPDTRSTDPWLGFAQIVGVHSGYLDRISDDGPHFMSQERKKHSILPRNVRSYERKRYPDVGHFLWSILDHFE